MRTIAFDAQMPGDRRSALPLFLSVPLSASRQQTSQGDVWGKHKGGVSIRLCVLSVSLSPSLPLSISILISLPLFSCLSLFPSLSLFSSLPLFSPLLALLPFPLFSSSSFHSLSLSPPLSFPLAVKRLGRLTDCIQRLYVVEGCLVTEIRRQ